MKQISNILLALIYLLILTNSYGYLTIPNIDAPMAQDKDTNTKTAIDTNIIINDKDKQTQDIVGISQDTKASHYRLHEVNREVLNIRKDVAGEVGKEAFKFVAHTIYDNNPELEKYVPKTVVHGIVGGIVSQIAGGSFANGATGAVVAHETAKLVMEKLDEEYKKGNINENQYNAMVKTSSSITAAIVTSVTGGSANDAAMAGGVGTNVVTNNDLAIPINKRLSDKNDIGHKKNNPYVKYDFAVFDYDNPEDFNKAIKEAGYNNIDEFREAYDKDPKGMGKKFNKIGQIDNMTFEARRSKDKGKNNGSITGKDGKWGKIYDSGNNTKYKYGITDDDSNINYSDNDYIEPRTYIKHHCGPTSSTGCITKTNKSWSEKNNKELSKEYQKNIPSLTDSTENTYEYVPKNGDDY